MRRWRGGDSPSRIRRSRVPILGLVCSLEGLRTRLYVGLLVNHLWMVGWIGLVRDVRGFVGQPKIRMRVPAGPSKVCLLDLL